MGVPWWYKIHIDLASLTAKLTGMDMEAEKYNSWQQ